MTDDEWVAAALATMPPLNGADLAALRAILRPDPNATSGASAPTETPLARQSA